MGMAQGGCCDAVRLSIARGVLLYAGNVDIAVRWAACALALPDHGAQAIHGVVVGQVQRVAPVRQQLHGLPDAPGLVNAALLTDGQVHGEVEKRVAFSLFGLQHGAQRSVHIR